jgi:flagellar FliJ protein
MAHAPQALGAALQLAAERHAAAEKLLAQAHARVNDARRTLDTLTRYRGDYAERWRTLTHADSAAIANFRRFLFKLDDAIAAQQLETQKCTEALHAAQHQWNDSRRRIRSLELLVERRQAVVLQRERKLEQKSSDEFAARRALNIKSLILNN